MNLFIESPRQGSGSLRASEHDAWLRAMQEQYAARAAAGASPGSTAPQGEHRACGHGRPDASYSVAQESYRDELAFHTHQVSRRKLIAAVRVVALIVLVPVLLAAVFLASYVMTCVINGATPGEVMELMRAMPERATEFLQALLSA